MILSDGSSIRVEVSADDETRAQGLMYRESVPPGQGMLFLFPEAGHHSFWMKNTMIALDMIWLDQSRRIVHIEREVPPCRADPCPSYGPAGVSRFVLELAGGQAARYGLKPGDQVTFRNIHEAAAAP